MDIVLGVKVGGLTEQLLGYRVHGGYIVVVVKVGGLTEYNDWWSTEYMVGIVLVVKVGGLTEQLV